MLGVFAANFEGVDSIRTILIASRRFLAVSVQDYIAFSISGSKTNEASGTAAKPVSPNDP
jgi:hypothetical protein